jgi:hypothetical protein
VFAAAEGLDVRPAVFVERAELLGSLALALQVSSDQFTSARVEATSLG